MKESDKEKRIGILNKYDTTVKDYTFRNFTLKSLESVCIIKTMSKKEIKRLKRYIKRKEYNKEMVQWLLNKGFSISDIHIDGVFPFGNVLWYKDAIKDIELY